MGLCISRAGTKTLKIKIDGARCIPGQSQIIPSLTIRSVNDPNEALRMMCWIYQQKSVNAPLLDISQSLLMRRRKSITTMDSL